MALKYYQLITVPLALNGCYRADVVFDNSLSIKVGKSEKRYASMALEVQIRGSASPVPKQ